MYTMVLSITHRITGVALSVGSLLLVYWLWAISSGAASYECTMKCAQSVWVKIVLVGFIFSFCYHLCNGIRHLTWDAGIGMEKHQARASGRVVAILSIVLTVIASVLLLRLIGAQS